jgi:hypothetical protein
MGREVEMRAQSQQGVHGIRGETITFKLSAQFGPTATVQPSSRTTGRIAGACRLDAQQPVGRNEIDISDPSNHWCLAYNICAGIKSVESPETDINEWAAHTNLQNTATNLLRRSGCLLDKDLYDRSDLAKIQHYLNQRFPKTFRLVLVQMNKILFKGPPAKHVIALRHSHEHFTLIRNLAVQMNVSEQNLLVWN